MLSKVVQVRAPKAAVTTRSVFMALPLSCFSAWIMAAWRDELTQTCGEEQICGAACGQLHTDEDRRRRDRRRWDDVHFYQKDALSGVCHVFPLGFLAVLRGRRLLCHL